MITCADCGAPYIENVIVASEDWERIADDGAYMLCFECMDRRCGERGMTVECDIVRYGGWLSTKTKMRFLWRRPEDIVVSGVGHPALYKGH